MTALNNLDERCPWCEHKAIGEHTLREWDAHMANQHTDLPYEPVAGGPIPLLTAKRDGVDIPIADSLSARAVVLTGNAGPMGIAAPCLLLDFEQGDPTGPPRPVYRIGLVGPPDVMRKFGKLLRDTAFGAANAAEKTTRP